MSPVSRSIYFKESNSIESTNAIAEDPSKKTITSFTSALTRAGSRIDKSNQNFSCLFNMVNYVDI